MKGKRNNLQNPYNKVRAQLNADLLSYVTAPFTSLSWHCMKSPHIYTHIYTHFYTLFPFLFFIFFFNCRVVMGDHDFFAQEPPQPQSLLRLAQPM